MELDVLLEILDKYGPHAFSIVIIVQIYLFGRELKQTNKELKKHREDEELTRKELIQVGTALAVLLDRDKRDVTAVKGAVEEVVREAVEEISGVHQKVDPAQLADAEATAAVATPVEVPAAGRPPRAKSRPGTPGAYAIIHPQPATENNKKG